MLLNRKDGTFMSMVKFNVGYAPQQVTASDIDNDGFVDLLVSNERSEDVSILLNTFSGLD